MDFQSPAVAGASMRLRYGLNLGDRWKEFACGPARDWFIERVRDAGTAMVRVFPDPSGHSPSGDWSDCVALLKAIQKAGATPMVAFACPDPQREPEAARKFRQDCREF